MAQQKDDRATAFPAPASAPGQKESRTAYQRFQDIEEGCPWWDDYLELRAAGWDWRKAAYIAWAASPTTGRWPETQKDLATQVLGLKSDRTIRKWRNKYPELEETVAAMQVAPLMRHRRDVIEALIASAKSASHLNHSDRKLFLEMSGDYKPRQHTELSGSLEVTADDIADARQRADEFENDLLEDE